MELRDQFATEAMKVLLTEMLSGASTEDYTWRELAQESYRMANEMIAARDAAPDFQEQLRQLEKSYGKER